MAKNKKALGNVPAPAPKVAPKREPKGGGVDTSGRRGRKAPPREVNQRRVLFISDVFFDPVKERAAAETRRRGVEVSPSEIVREAIAEYLGLDK